MVAYSDEASKGIMSAQPKGFAVRRLKRGPNGRIQVVFVDVKTGKEVNPDTYNVITPAELPGELDLQQKPENDPKEKKEERSLTEETVLPESRSGGDLVNQVAGEGIGRTAANNYGYINKPGIMNMAGSLPGPFGFFGNLANTAININNTVATNEAKSMLGMEKKGFLSDIAKNAVASTKLGSKFVDTTSGYIGDISVPGEERTIPVGFEAQDALGRTTLTPDEARMRQQLAGATPATPMETAASKQAFKQENPQQQGLIRSLFSGAKSVFSNLFSAEDQQTDRLATEGSSYPDRPSLSDSERSRITQSLSASDGFGSDPLSESQQARDAVNSGIGGLW